MIPKYERSVDSEIIENSLRGATGITTPYKILSTQRRKQRLSTPISTNFISSYREKVNKAGKKIRDLLNQLDDKNEQ